MNEIVKGYGTVENNDNVLDLQRDEKLKLQLEIRKMASDLKKDVADSKKTSAINKLNTHFDNLLHKGTIERIELNSIKQDIVDQYT
jgi:predicted glycosyltransferase